MIRFEVKIRIFKGNTSVNRTCEAIAKNGIEASNNVLQALGVTDAAFTMFVKPAKEVANEVL